MSRRKRKAADSSELAAELGPEDGSDPRDFHARPWNAPKKASRKGLQLCEQVKHALEAAIPGCGDARLHELVILDVRLAPHSGRLLVLMSAPEADDSETLRIALAGAVGFLRCQVAAGICRRHAPELVFELIGR